MWGQESVSDLLQYMLSGQVKLYSHCIVALHCTDLCAWRDNSEAEVGHCNVQGHITT